MRIHKEYYDKEQRAKTKKYYNDKISSDVMRYQKKYGFELNDIKGHETWNVEADAFKHAYGSALMSLEKDDLFSFLAGLQHENVTPNNPVDEYEMDTHNNAVGRQIANDIKKSYGDKWKKLSKQEQEDIIADTVWKHMQSGDLILSPKGRRKLKGGNRKTKSDSAKTKCVGSYPVSGYTRANGTEVKGYIRTCGAKHSSNNNYSSKYAPESPVSVEDSKSDKPDDIPAIIMTEKERVLKKYKDKKAQDLSKSEIDEFLKAIWG